jgi:hypothetical protein
MQRGKLARQLPMRFAEIQTTVVEFRTPSKKVLEVKTFVYHGVQKRCEFLTELDRELRPWGPAVWLNPGGF